MIVVVNRNIAVVDKLFAIAVVETSCFDTFVVDASTIDILYNCYYYYC